MQVHTPELIGRAEELTQLRHLVGRGPGDVQVTGGPGVGKTKVLQAVMAELAERGVDCIAVSCRPSMRTAGILVQILRAYTPHYPTAGFSQDSMASDLGRLLAARARQLVIALDDHDALKDGSEVRNTLHRLGVPVTLMLGRRTPLNEPDLVTLNLAPYRRTQARELIRSHATSRLSPVILDALASMGAKDGMTRALVALAAIREPTGNAELARVTQAAHDRFNEQTLRELPDHHLFILAALAQQDGPMRSRHLRNAYTALANANKEKARANVQFLKYVDQLARGRFVEVKPLRGNGLPGGALAVTLRCAPEVALREVEAALARRTS